MTKRLSRIKRGRPVKQLNSPLPIDQIDALLKNGADPLGLMHDMKKAIIERALNAELDYHLSHDTEPGNSRNGYGSKEVITDHGNVSINTPRDRSSSFEPQLISKRQRSLRGFDEKVIAMYARGMSMSEIKGYMEDIYATEVSVELLSNIVDEVMSQVKEWQNRPLDSLYPILYLDAMVVKVRDNGQVINKSLYMALGVNIEGHKEILGLWLSRNEGAKFWLQVINDLKNRGVEDIFISCVDGLKGFPEAINSVYPQTQVQRCIVHMVRYSLNYVPWKDRKDVANALKAIYRSNNEESAKDALNLFKENWDDKYPMISECWSRNWAEIVPFLSYPEFIRKAIYTTNAIESAHRQIRKIIKSKGLFPNDEAVLKIVFLALQNAQKKWNMPIRNWKLALNQFAILFEDRMVKF